MPELDRIVAGIRCRDVLAALSDYIDGDLQPGRVAQINAHLEGCDHCERFGGQFSSVMSGLKKLIASPNEDQVSRDRILGRLREALGHD